MFCNTTCHLLFSHFFFRLKVQYVSLTIFVTLRRILLKYVYNMSLFLFLICVVLNKLRPKLLMLQTMLMGLIHKTSKLKLFSFVRMTMNCKAFKVRCSCPLQMQKASPIRNSRVFKSCSRPIRTESTRLPKCFLFIIRKRFQPFSRECLFL